MELGVGAIIQLLHDYGPIAAAVMMYIDKRQALKEANQTIRDQHREIKELSERTVAGLTQTNSNVSTWLAVLGSRK